MANDKDIPGLNELFIADAVDLLVIEDISAGETKRIRTDNLLSSSVSKSDISGVDNIPNDSSSISIVFVVDQTSADYAVTASLENSVDSEPSIYAHIIKNKTVNGFTVLFSGSMDSDNYYLNWIVESRIADSGEVSSSSSSRSSSSLSSSSSSLSSSSSSNSSSSSLSSSSLSLSSSSRSSSSSSNTFLMGFPEDSTSYIQVVIGTGWTNSAPFVEDEVINLYNIPGYPGYNFWSEDGTNVANSLTNRILLSISTNNVPDYGQFTLNIQAIPAGNTGSSFVSAAIRNIYTSQFGFIYTFGEVFNSTGFQLYGYSPFFSGNNLYDYKNVIFKTMTMIG